MTPNSVSAEPAAGHVAVCLLPGTEVAFEREVECQHIFKIFRSQKLIGEKVARFRQIKTEVDPDQVFQFAQAIPPARR